MTNQYPDAQKLEYRNIFLIWIAMVVSIVMYAAITEFVILSKNEPASADATFYYILLGLSIVEVLAIPFIKNYFGTVTWTPSETPDPEEVIQVKRSKFNTSHTIAFAIAESPALYGLILAFIHQADRPRFYIFIAISAIAMVMHFPSRTKWESLDGMR